MSKPAVNLGTPLSLRAAFRFPLQSAQARREVLIGALWLLVPFVGWLLNMGHRIEMVHRMQHGRPAWPAWRDYPSLLRHGTLTFLGMVYYNAPATVCGGLALHLDLPWLLVVSAVLWVVATLAVPGYMSHYCRAFEAREIFHPLRALRRVFEGGSAYWRAWGIALAALVLSFTGLLAFGIGFLVTSVWFWQVAGYAFANVFSRRFGLAAATEDSR
jgi:hypothetical protein